MGGKASDCRSLNDMGTTISVGATSQVATSTQNSPSKVHWNRFIGCLPTSDSAAA